MIKDTLQVAIKSLSGKYEIDPPNLRIKISKPSRDLEYHIMEKDKIVDKTNVATALNLNTLTAFMVSNKLNSIFDKLSVQNQIDKSNMNVRIYTKSEDYSPLLYLFDGTNPKRQVSIEELT